MAKTIKMAVTAKDVAREFAKVLHNWLGEKTMVKVVNLNEESGDKYGDSICHSADFCDSNMAMAEAFEKLGLKTAADLSEGGETPEWNESVRLWNEAWKIAKLADFDPDRV